MSAASILETEDYEPASKKYSKYGDDYEKPSSKYESKVSLKHPSGHNLWATGARSKHTLTREVPGTHPQERTALRPPYG